MHLANEITILVNVKGVNELTDSNLLKEKIKESGYKMNFIASKLGLTYPGFLKKVNNESDFKVIEMQILCGILNISEEDRERIFFATSVDELSTT